MSVGAGTIGGTFVVGAAAGGGGGTVTVTTATVPLTVGVSGTVPGGVAAAVYIAGVAYQWESRTLSVTWRAGGRWTGRLVVVGDGDFQRGDPVRIVTPSAGELFTGYVDRAQKTTRNPNGVTRHVVSVMDHRWLAEKRVVAAEWLNRTASNIVRDLHSGFLGDIPQHPTGILSTEGVTTAGSIDPAPTVPRVVANYVTVAEVLDALADRSGFVWFIDLKRRLHFHSASSSACCPPLTTPITPADMTAGSFTVETGSRRHRNRETVTGGRNLTVTQTETLDPDGAVRSFTVGYPIAQVPTVRVAGVAQTVGILGVSTAKQWYWQKGSSVVTQDPTEPVVTAGQSLTVEYRGEYPTVVVLADAGDAVADAARTGTSGIVEHVTRVSPEFDTDDAIDTAAAVLATYAARPVTVEFGVRDWTRTDLRPGVEIEVQHPDLAAGTATVTVASVTVTHAGGRLYRQTVTATDGPVDGDPAALFRPAPQRGDVLLNVADSATFNLVTPFEAALTVTEVVSTTVYVCSLYNGASTYDSAATYC